MRITKQIYVEVKVGEPGGYLPKAYPKWKTLKWYMPGNIPSNTESEKIR